MSWAANAPHATALRTIPISEIWGGEADKAPGSVRSYAAVGVADTALMQGRRTWYALVAVAIGATLLLGYLSFDLWLDIHGIPGPSSSDFLLNVFVTASVILGCAALALIARDAWGAYALSVAASVFAVPLALMAVISLFQPTLTGPAARISIPALPLDVWVALQAWRLGESLRLNAQDAESRRSVANKPSMVATASCSTMPTMAEPAVTGTRWFVGILAGLVLWSLVPSWDLFGYRISPIVNLVPAIAVAGFIVRARSARRWLTVAWLLAAIALPLWALSGVAIPY
jgi:hypothetical protein